jgi:hypothetical protein
MSKEVAFMAAIHPQILEQGGKKRFAILPYEEFNRLLEDLADYEDLRLLREAKAEEKDVPGVGLKELKKQLGITDQIKRRPQSSSKRG